MTGIRPFAAGLLLCLVLAAAPEVPAAEGPSYSVKATSHATKSGNDESLDNTRFEFTGCGSNAAEVRLLLRLRLTSKSNTDEEGMEGQVRLDAFRAAAGTSAAEASAAEASAAEVTAEPEAVPAGAGSGAAESGSDEA